MLASLAVQFEDIDFRTAGFSLDLVEDFRQGDGKNDLLGLPVSWGCACLRIGRTDARRDKRAAHPSRTTLRASLQNLQRGRPGSRLGPQIVAKEVGRGDRSSADL